ncbi:MAG TPA: nitrophenyl compound nitroreductase subunit ArsF family protein [bacterium]|nr:nitrophenyl compound nitroreductase subunit ArsF family protein [bacterium]
MNAKKIVTILLTLFTAAGIVYAVIGGGTPTTDPAPAAPAAETKKAAPSVDGLTVYYFHTSFRCHSCLTIERLTHETLNEQFAAEQKSGAIRWQMVNYEEGVNERYIDQYKLYTKQVILSALKGGSEVAWKDLDEVWTLKNDEMRFKLYIADEIKKFRAENGL